MKTTITWRDAGCSSACGYSVQVIHTLSTFDKMEIDKYIQFLKDNVGGALIFDFESCVSATKAKSRENCKYQ